MPELRIEYIPLSELVRWPRNPKDHDLGAISGSFKRFGFVTPIVIDERSGRLVAGHGRLDTLQSLKAQGKPAPNRIKNSPSGDWLVPVLRGISFENDTEAEAYIVADNRLTEIGGWDEFQLTELLADLASEDDGLIGTGYDEDDVDRMLQSLEKDKTRNSEPEIEFTTEVLEAQNYVLFTFDNEIDWNFIRENLGIHAVDALDSKPGYRRRGVGRVLDGAMLIDLIRAVNG